MKEENEIWVPIKNYENYMISNFGKVYSNITNKILKQEKTKNNYYRVALSNKTKTKHFLIHRLVAEHFIPNDDNKLCVNHKNGNKGCNYDWNLEWCTYKENINHAFKNKLIVIEKGKNNPMFGRTGKLSNCKRKIKQLDKNNNELNIFSTVREASKKYNIQETNIVKCCRGKIKTAGGYVWRYVNE